MTNEVTNEAIVSPPIQIQNNTWTLLKHAAGSVNKAAAKVDAKVYGPIVKQGTVQLPPQPAPEPPKSDINAFTVIGIIVVALLAVGVFIAWCGGHIKGRDFIGF